ncbi:MAG: FtsH protease activity modulator HflK [Deltaproteobacteria bacterium]|nr:FtsH protease activity modulator HflK [Deltaproteobacteria bacterium]
MAWDWDKLKDQQKDRRPVMPPIPPKVEEVFRRFSGPGRDRFAWLWAIPVLLLLMTLYSMFYTVQANEQAVMQRFGRYTVTQGPGIHMKLPYPIETATKVNVLEYRTETFGDEVGVQGEAGHDLDTDNVALMLTGDLNVAVVPWIVQYRVSEAKDFLFNVRNAQKTLRDLAEAAMRQVVGDHSIDEIISKRSEINTKVRKLLQKELDIVKMGITVKDVALKTATVPPPVLASFNEVNQARQEREQLIYQAKEEYNKAIPAAIGDAQKTIKYADGYAVDRTNRAKGDAALFSSVWAEYEKAPEVTRRRLYLEAMKDILPNLGKVFIIDSRQRNLVPLLDVGKTGVAGTLTEGGAPK